MQSYTKVTDSEPCRMVSTLSAVKTMVSIDVRLLVQAHGGSSSEEDCPHSTHVPMNLLAGRVSVSTTGGVGSGSGSGSGRSHAANRAEKANAATQNTPRIRLPLFANCNIIFPIVLGIKLDYLIRQKYVFSIFGRRILRIASLRILRIMRIEN